MAERKAIFITGGGSGIGRAVAIHFAKQGWFVGIGDINRAGLEATRDLMQSGFCYLHQFDVCDRAAWDEALDAFSIAAGGRIDVLFNNAGIARGGPVAENPVADIEQVLDINLKGVIFGAQAAYPHLKKTAPGSMLLNTASLAGIIGSPGLAVYCATKWAVRGLTESLDAEWAADGIKVASLCPGFIDTPIIAQVAQGSNETMKDRLRSAGVEIRPVEDVLPVVWQAIHGNELHYTVGQSARRLNFLKRWLPGKVRKEMRQRGIIAGEPT